MSKDNSGFVCYLCYCLKRKNRQMKKIGFILFILLTVNIGFAQSDEDENKEERTVLVDDPFYREDHFYVGVSHSILQDKPKGFVQRSFSPNIVFGFLRDIPVNEQRNWAIAPGVGLSYQSIRSNFATLSHENNDYEIVEDYDKNRLSAWYIDIPLEFRWRTSTMYSHKFWRIYLGVKYSYLVYNQSNYKGYYGNIEIKNNPDLNKSLFGVYISGGFNTWNAYVYYGFSPVYKENNHAQRLRYLNVGLMFYIL